MIDPKSHLDRRNFLKLSGNTLMGTALLAATASTAERTEGNSRAGSAGENAASVIPQPFPKPDADQTTADILIETLIAWGATHVFGIEGDGIAGIIEAFRKRQDRIRYVGVRHEEAAAFMAEVLSNVVYGVEGASSWVTKPLVVFPSLPGRPRNGCRR